MKFGNLLHNLVDITHGSFGDEISKEAHDAVTDLERRLIALENHVHNIHAGDVSRETSAQSITAVDMTTTTTPDHLGMQFVEVPNGAQ